MCKDKHRQKLKEMKCSIDNAPPKRHSHLHKNLKKEQLMEERFAEIELENTVLLAKLSKILRRSRDPTKGTRDWDGGLRLTARCLSLASCSLGLLPD